MPTLQVLMLLLCPKSPMVTIVPGDTRHYGFAGTCFSVTALPVAVVAEVQHSFLALSFMLTISSRGVTAAKRS